MLLDPLEEQFHLPATFVERADGGCRKGEFVGEEHQRLARIGILESDAAQRFGIVLAADNTSEHDGLVADDARAALDRSRVDAPKFGVGLCKKDEEGVCLMHQVKPCEVQIDRKSTRLKS